MTYEEAERWCERHEFRFYSFTQKSKVEPGIEPVERIRFSVSGWAWPPKREKVRIFVVGDTLAEAVEQAKIRWERAIQRES